MQTDPQGMVKIVQSVRLARSLRLLAVSGLTSPVAFATSVNNSLSNCPAAVMTVPVSKGGLSELLRQSLLVAILTYFPLV